MNNCNSNSSAILADMPFGTIEMATVIANLCKSLEIARYDLAIGQTGAAEATLSRLIISLTSVLDRIATTSTPGAVRQVAIPSGPDQYKATSPT